MIQRNTMGATVADLYKVRDKAELVQGEIVITSPASAGHGRRAGRIYQSLLKYEERTGKGIAIPDNVGFIVDLPHRRSFSPDAAYFFGPYNEDEFLDGAPAFAAKVRSSVDFGPVAEHELAAKRADYFAAGTQVVWDVDPLRERVVRAYRAAAPDSPDIFREGDEADAEPAVPAWRVRVDELMPPGASTTD